MMVVNLLEFALTVGKKSQLVILVLEKWLTISYEINLGVKGVVAKVYVTTP